MLCVLHEDECLSRTEKNTSQKLYRMKNLVNGDHRIHQSQLALWKIKIQGIK